jgi:hypothetical protein
MRKSTISKSKNAKGRKVTFTPVKKSIVTTVQQPKPKPYTSFIPKGTFKAGGGFLGSYLGPVGRRVGEQAGDLLSRIVGFGDYEVKQNSLIPSSGPPVFQHGRRGTVNVCHRECLGDITGSVAFSLASYPINPGLSATFPLLSLLAANFEQYHMKGLVFEFKSLSSNAMSSTNTALGSVIMATNYDSLQANFTSKIQMEAYEFATSEVPSKSNLHAIECMRRLNVLENHFVRTGVVPATGDIHLYDCGNFQLATSGMQAAAVIGELWVSYDCDLIRPKIPTPLGSNLPFAHLREYPALTAAAAGSAFLGTTGTSTGVPGVGTLSSASTLPIITTPSTFTLPIVGRYLVSYQLNGSVTGIGAFTPGANITSNTLAIGNNGFSLRQSTTSNTAVGIVLFDVNTPGTGAANAITLSGYTGQATGNTDIFITQISSITTSSAL